MTTYSYNYSLPTSLLLSEKHIFHCLLHGFALLPVSSLREYRWPEQDHWTWQPCIERSFECHCLVKKNLYLYFLHILSYLSCLKSCSIVIENNHSSCKLWYNYDVRIYICLNPPDMWLARIMVYTICFKHVSIATT